MGTTEFAAFVERALFLDRDDPVAAWQELRELQARLVERLTPARELRIEAEGTDLTLNVERPHLDQLRRQAQHALRRGLHRPARDARPRAGSASRSRRAPAGVDVSGIELEFREAARGRRPARSAARST